MKFVILICIVILLTYYLVLRYLRIFIYSYFDTPDFHKHLTKYLQINFTYTFFDVKNNSIYKSNFVLPTVLFHNIYEDKIEVAGKIVIILRNNICRFLALNLINNTD